MVVKLTGKEFAFITPAPVIAFIIGFVLYWILAKAGLQPPVVELAAAQSEEPAAPQAAAEDVVGGADKYKQEDSK
jgi:hypothetical protein